MGGAARHKCVAVVMYIKCSGHVLKCCATTCGQVSKWLACIAVVVACSIDNYMSTKLLCVYLVAIHGMEDSNKGHRGRAIRRRPGATTRVHHKE